MSYWNVLIIALGILFIGVRFIIHPLAGATGFGISLANDSDAVYGQIKGIRDAFSGLLLLPLLWLRLRKATAWVFTAAVVVPSFDFLMILFHKGSGNTLHLAVHGGTALFMLITSFLLFRENDKPLNA
ncbi:DUF4267 domain-containing protein [Mucilaginibacter sp. HD30]